MGTVQNQATNTPAQSTRPVGQLNTRRSLLKFILLGIITLVSIQSYFIREFQAISMSLQPGMTGGTQHTIALYALSARLSHVGLFILFGFICFRQGLGKSFSGAVLIINSAQQLIGFGVFWERLLL